MPIRTRHIRNGTHQRKEAARHALWQRLLGGQCLSLADYVAVTGTRGGATAAGGPFMLPSLLTTYDALDRPTQVTYQDASTRTYTWGAGNRLTQLIDSNSGTITRSYDG